MRLRDRAVLHIQFARGDEAVIVIGLGSGRSGTHSLAQLLNAQEGSVCFHEVNPAGAKWSGAAGSVLAQVGQFNAILHGGPRDRISIDYSSPNRDAPLARLRELKEVELIGDIGLYYLEYVPHIVEAYPNVRFPCIRRGKAETVESFVNKVRLLPLDRRKRIWEKLGRVFGIAGSPTHRNHWVDHNGTVWGRDRIWDKCFPKFPATTLREALGLYWDYYYDRAKEIAAEFPGLLRIFDLDELNTDAGQRGVLEFCGVAKPTLVDVHSNRGAAR